MAIREDIVASAVTFLQDPSVSGSPIESRIAFLQSKNLTQEEVDTALARANGESAPPVNQSSYAPPQVNRQPQQNYANYQQYPWQQPPPELPKRDWRDWFIMATVMGGVGYGLYFVAKRYVYPVIAPPTAPQLEQDKQAIDDQFEKAFTLLDQLSKDTDALKTSEQARTERLDAALTEVESVMGELKNSSKRREEDSRRISNEVRGLKDLIPKAMDGQKENTDVRLRELNTELKSLKTLMGQRLNPPSTSGPGSYGRSSGVSALNATVTPTTPNSNALTSNALTNPESTAPKPASVSNGANTESVPSIRSGSPFGTGIPGGKAAIPSWQLASSKSTSSADNSTASASGSQEASTSTSSTSS